MNALIPRRAGALVCDAGLACAAPAPGTSSTDIQEHVVSRLPMHPIGTRGIDAYGSSRVLIPHQVGSILGAPPRVQGRP